MHLLSVEATVVFGVLGFRGFFIGMAIRFSDICVPVPSTEPLTTTCSALTVITESADLLSHPEVSAPFSLPRIWSPVGNKMCFV